MSFEDDMRRILREELARRDEQLAERVADMVRARLGEAAGEDRLLSPEEVKRLTGYSAETVKGWVRAGKLRRYGTIRAWRVSERQLRQLLAQQPTPGAPKAPRDDAKILALARERAARGR